MQLLKKDSVIHFVWKPEAQASFVKLQRAVTTAPVLATPNFTRTIVVECDASCFGLGAVVIQKGQRIAYYSKALSYHSFQISLQDGVDGFSAFCKNIDGCI